jgi:hypothetical protein
MHLIYIFSKSCDQRIKDICPQNHKMPTCGRVGVRRRGQGSIGWLVPRRPVQCVLGHLPPTRCDCVLCIAAVEVESVVDRPSQDVAGWLGAFVSLVEQAALSLQHAICMQAQRRHTAARCQLLPRCPLPHWPLGRAGGLQLLEI